MRIAVNLLPFQNKLGGAGQYAKNIVRELSEIDNNNEYYLFLTEGASCHFILDNKKFHLIFCPFNSNSILLRIFWEQYILPFQLRKKNIELLFTPSVAVPIFCRIKKVTTIHDLAFKFYKKKYPFFRRVYVSLITRMAAVKSDFLFTVSNSSKNDIIAKYNLENKKIAVTYNGVHEKFYTPHDTGLSSAVKEKYSIPDEFILYVGAIEPGKNLDKVIRAFERILKTNPNLKLLVTGGLGWQKEYFLKLITAYQIESQVQILPYVLDDELPIIYKLAKLFIYISPYEGFGMPVLEAMASGIPVIASDIPSIREFANSYALLVNPDNENEIISAFNKIFQDDEFRLHIMKNQITRSKEYTWRKSAEIVLDVFNQFKKEYHE